MMDGRTDDGDLAARLSRHHPKLIDLSLGRMERLLARLGHPERGLPPVVHVAGTNGKGSAVAFMAAMAGAAGLRVHTYTSPHMIRFNERIRIAGQVIDDGALSALLDECEAANGDDPITFFEITTALAFLAFSRTPADLVLLETGLGGRFDATNVIAHPALTLLTPISRDHENFLGADLTGIAGEKAAIMKPGAPSVSATQAAQAMEVVRAQAARTGVRLILEGKDFATAETAEGMVFEGAGGTLRLPRPALAGAHQIANAGLAIAALLEIREIHLGEREIATGLRHVHWPGRLERLTRGPHADMVPEGWELWLDGGHNGAAGAALAVQAERWAQMPLWAVCAMLGTKDTEAFLAPLAPFLQGLRAIAVPGEAASLPAREVAARAQKLGIPAKAEPDAQTAIQALVAEADVPGRILVCGSLYLAGSFLRENE